LKRLTAFLLLGLFLLQLGTKLFVELDFLLNQTTIIEKLCENKVKPEMQCNGKCYLMKELAKLEAPAENSEDQVPSYPTYFKSVDCFTEISFMTILNPSETDKARLTLNFYQNFYTLDCIFDIDYPPAIA
jgi:hypothetical protein